MSEDSSQRKKSGPLPLLDVGADELEKLEAEARALTQRLEEVTGRLMRTVGERQAKAQPQPDGRALTFRRKRVLVLEDDVDARQGLAAMLERLGHSHVEAADGLEGLIQLEGYSADVVMVDLVMPRLDGFTFARRVREAFGPLAPMLIAYSGQTRAGIREDAIAAGFDHFVQKPVRIEDLMFLLQQKPLRS